MLPLAHLGHYLWVFYLIPVIIVLGGIVYSSIKGRPDPDHDPEPGRGPPGEGSGPGAGDSPSG